MILVKPSYEIDPSHRTGAEILKRLEAKARVCYKSEERITEESSIKFLKMLIHDKHHYSVLRHDQMSVKLTCSRAVSHQIVRHGLAHFLQESQRYCNYSKKNDGNVVFVIPHWLDLPEGKFDPLNFLVTYRVGSKETVWLSAMMQSEKDYNMLLSQGCKPEEAREVLPTSCKTEVVITANLEAWRHIFRQRADDHADAAMQWMMRPLLKDFKNIIPVIFDDL